MEAPGFYSFFYYFVISKRRFTIRYSRSLRRQVPRADHARCNALGDLRFHNLHDTNRTGFPRALVQTKAYGSGPKHRCKWR